MTTDMHKAPSMARKALTSTDDATPVACYDLSTSEGGRRYIADFFATELRRHDFAGYINTHLAADFACALAQHLAATGKQQAGEVHGDAHVVVLREMRARLTDAGSPARTAALDAAIAALAARQPGAQGPVAGPYLDEPDAPSNPLWKRLRSIANWLTVLAPDCHMEAAELLLTASARIQRNDAAPPAQGIDLGPLVVSETADETDAEWLCRKARAEGWNAYRDALIGQRDAAPGVGP